MSSLKLTLLSAALIALGVGEARAANAGHPAVQRALDLLRSHAGAARTSGGDGYRTRDVIVDADGTEHVRFDRTYGGLPVIGGDLVMHSSSGRLKSTSVTQGAALNLSTRPSLQSTDAVVVAGLDFGTDFDAMPASTLVVYARGRGAARLAWQVALRNARADMTYMVDAHNGRILEQWSNRHTANATGTARTLYSGDVALATNSITGGYELRDLSRGKAYTIDASNSRTSGQTFKDTDNLWGNYTTSDMATAAADAHYGSAVTWDYFKNVHARLGIANDGKAAYSRVHYGRRYSNAFWNDGCFCMTYGDGDGVNIGPLVSLDITGHEMSHGVNARSANLIYAGESGGLNEANSDILGTMVEFHAKNSQDTPDYLIGEKIFVGNVAGSVTQSALRYMFNPAADGRSPNCYVNTLGQH